MPKVSEFERRKKNALKPSTPAQNSFLDIFSSSRPVTPFV
ncbi:hypothetical protein PSE_2313 [Pseudovibrio sp. FO-BEG1]|nr:hypothetical protein PSE_2313 [Pseudovibrio sp. FO-BEG1]